MENHQYGVQDWSRLVGDVIMYSRRINTKDSDGDAFSLLQVQTLRNFPREKLAGEVVAVRLDSTLIHNTSPLNDGSANKALHTIKYLHDAGAKVLLLSSWDYSSNPDLLSIDYFADHISSVLQLRVLRASGFSDIIQLKTEEMRDGDILLFENLAKFKEDLANCLDFSKKLSAGVGVFVNDAFCLAHKIYASTVGISRFCYSSVAGFHFEEELNKLASIAETTERPYIAVIGGKNFLEKRTALCVLATKCDGLMLIGKLSFQIMHALGMSIPMNLIEDGAVDKAFDLIQFAKKRGMDIIFPDDFRCVNDEDPEVMDVFSSDGIQPGWTPVDLGPVSLQNISSRLLNCKKVLLIGPMTFKACEEGAVGVSMLSKILEKISGTGCEVSVVGNASYKSLVGPGDGPYSSLPYKHFENASVVWEFLKGRALPGVAALDRAFPFEIDWESIFYDPTQPLVVDLVVRCLDEVLHCGLKNVHFLPTNATSTFRSIISSYPGKLVLVSIQCPNPDFNKPEHRWKMVQRMLIEAIVDLLATDGKVRGDEEIKEDFLLHGRGRLALEGGDGGGWIRENPFGVRSDWEKHVLARGNPMYRMLLRKVDLN
ncbi:unnamed protein product [Spirodela intermedia]|uniref:Phosphoglycerate kinase n=1 Tax=Spirodela intermedia TaxID=51605 RepID=A0A7I8ICH4_SPIIN|nr:unnamed protein product [Spirodela intermedia]CAA6655528.1 unnamed protein product [Spirodela intermedia]